MFGLHKKTYHMDEDAAKQTLANVLVAVADENEQSAATDPSAFQESPRRRSGQLFRVSALVILGIMLAFLIVMIISLSVYHRHALAMETVYDSTVSMEATGCEYDRGFVKIRLSDGSVDLKKSYSETASGVRTPAVSFNRGRNEITCVYPDPPEETQIYIYYENGQMLHLRLTPME